MSRTCLITGASKGIGAATVIRLSETNPDFTRFILVARRSPAFDATVAECRERFAHAEYIPFYKDLARAEETLSIVTELRASGCNVDVVINNAGYTHPESIHEIDVEDFRYTLEVNVIAPFLLIQKLLQAGNQIDVIVNIASTAGMQGRPGWLTYSASKAAMINMSEVLRQELVIYGTRVVCLSPGRCATDLRKRLAPDEDPTTIMQPEAVADVIGVMLSSKGKFIDSANLVVRL